MIIDLILDRRADDVYGDSYNPELFRTEVREYEEFLDPCDMPITKALESGDEEKVREALCAYIIYYGYRHEFKHFIRNVRWL